MPKMIKLSGVSQCPFCETLMWFNHSCPQVKQWMEENAHMLFALDYFYG